mgnify:CR=1 FL=1
MTTKPYVPHKGIKHNPIIAQTKAGKVTITDYTPSKVQGRRVIEATLGGKRGYVPLDSYPEIDAAIKAENERHEAEFVARYPGVYELVAAQNDAEYRYERLQREIESGDGILSNSIPERDPAEAAKQYPIAAAYLQICDYCDNCSMSNVGMAKSSTGNWAIEQIKNGADVITTRDEMVKRYRNTDTTDYGN